MKSSKVKTQKNLSALIAFVLALVTMFSALAAESSQPEESKHIKLVEADIISQIDQMLLEDEEDEMLEEIVLDELPSEVKVFGHNDELLGSGNTLGNDELRTLVNKAELVSELGQTKYYKILR